MFACCTVHGSLAACSNFQRILVIAHSLNSFSGFAKPNDISCNLACSVIGYGALMCRNI